MVEQKHAPYRHYWKQLDQVTGLVTQTLFRCAGGHRGSQPATVAQIRAALAICNSDLGRLGQCLGASLQLAVTGGFAGPRCLAK